MYEIWYCPHYPIERITFSSKVDRTGREEQQAALAEDIRENGLVNPIVVLNHCPPKYQGYYCKQGLNRLAAVKLLGWSTIPVIFTGPCDHEEKVAVDPYRLQEYFLDGEIEIFGRTHASQGPKLQNTIPPETYTYPHDLQWTPVRKGVYLHEDYSGKSKRYYKHRRPSVFARPVLPALSCARVRSEKALAAIELNDIRRRRNIAVDRAVPPG